jgi:hypothetical protein
MHTYTHTHTHTHSFTRARTSLSPLFCHSLSALHECACAAACKYTHMHTYTHTHTHTYTHTHTHTHSHAHAHHSLLCSVTLSAPYMNVHALLPALAHACVLKTNAYTCTNPRALDRKSRRVWPSGWLMPPPRRREGSKYASYIQTYV